VESNPSSRYGVPTGYPSKLEVKSACIGRMPRGEGLSTLRRMEWLVSKLEVDCVKFGRGKKSDMPARHEINRCSSRLGRKNMRCLTKAE
jgi:hypothetical protein